MYKCERWAIKKVGDGRFDAFKLWCWRRLSRVPWTARRSNQSIFKEINPELKGLMLKLWLQYFDHLMHKSCIGKDTDAGKDWRQKEKKTTEDDSWRASLTQWTWILGNSRREWRRGEPGMLQSMGSQRVGHDLATEQLKNQNFDFKFWSLYP